MDKIAFDNPTDALLDDAYGEVKEQITKCEPCNARFNFKGRRFIGFCPYCGSAVIDGSERQTVLTNDITQQTQ